MTVKRRFAQFSIFSSALALLLACGSAQKSTASASEKSESTIQGEAQPSTTMDGSVIVISVKLPDQLKESAVSGEFEGIELPFFKNGEAFQSVLGVPYDHKPGAVFAKVRLIEKGSNTSRVVEVPFTITKGDYTSESIHVQKSKVHPQNPKDVARIVKEQAEIKSIYDTIIPHKYWEGPFTVPIPSAVTSRFGTKRLYNGVQNSFHPGLDLKAPEGTPIHADAAGKVVMAKDLFFTGYTVMLDHGYGVITLYAHMSKLMVSKDQEVKAGQLLGLSGKTGRVTGPHLHWQAVIHKQKVNPMDLTRVLK
jgi:murein DD-endopeptidase MepM/ murein hydrolase activator NlpD